jgi:hypothetical protein
MEQMKEKNCDYRANAWKVFHSLQIRCGAQREAIEDLKKKDCSHLGECWNKRQNWNKDSTK